MHEYESRKDPKTKVEAWQLTEENYSEVVNWTQGQLVEEIHPLTGTKLPGINIKTDGGFKRASVGDYVIKYLTEFYVGKPGQFERNYRPVSPDYVRNPDDRS